MQFNFNCCCQKKKGQKEENANRTQQNPVCQLWAFDFVEGEGEVAAQSSHRHHCRQIMLIRLKHNFMQLTLSLSQQFLCALLFVSFSLLLHPSNVVSFIRLNAYYNVFPLT